MVSRDEGGAGVIRVRATRRDSRCRMSRTDRHQEWTHCSQPVAFSVACMPDAVHRRSAGGLTSPRVWRAPSLAGGTRREESSPWTFSSRSSHAPEAMASFAFIFPMMEVARSRGPRRIKTHPFCGGYGMRGAIELPDGGLLLPLPIRPSTARCSRLLERLRRTGRRQR